MLKKSPQSVATVLAKGSPELAKILRRVAYLQKINIILGEILQDPLRKHCVAANVNAGQLVILVDSPVWATRLRYQQEDVLNQLTSNANYSDIQRLVIKNKPKSSGLHQAVQPPTTPSPDNSPTMQNLIENIADPGLQKALTRLIKKLKH